MKIKEVIVVEGRHDTIKVQQAVAADTIETGGSALGADVLERIRLAQARRGVIILTDPDYPGERIRREIDRAVPGCRHAFLPRKEALSAKGECGVEHASLEAIRNALKRSRLALSEGKGQQEPAVLNQETISWEELVAAGLVGGPRAKALRENMGRKLGIGYGNAQQFYKRLTVFGITPEEFRLALEEAEKEVLP